MNRIIIEVDDNIHKQIKILAALEGQTIKKFILDKVLLDNKKIKNKATLQAVKDAVEEKNLSKYETVKDLYKNLGI